MHISRIMSGSSSSSILAQQGDDGPPDTLMAHEGHVWVDDVNGGQVLTHCLLQERWPLPAGGQPWSLVFVDGFGCLVSDTTDQVLFLEEWLPEQVWLQGSEMIVVQKVVKNGKAGLLQFSLNARMREHQVRSCKLVVGDCEFDIGVFTITRPRASGRLLWSLYGIYHKLGLTSYFGQPSKWAYNSYEAWQKILSPMGYSNCIVKGWAGLDPQEAMASTDRILPTPAITSAGFLILCCRWGCSTSRRGGLRDRKAQAMALDILKTLVKATTKRQFQIKLQLSLDWEFRWPRPDMEGASTLTLVVEPSGLVDLSVWKRMVDESKTVGADINPVARAWFSMFESAVSTEGFMKLEDFFVHPGLANNDRFTPMLGQVVKVIAERIDMCYFQSMDLDACDWVLRADLPQDDGEWSLRAIDRLVTQHVYAGKMASAGIKRFGMAVDKYSAHLLDICNGVVVLPNNIAYEAVTQVAQIRSDWSRVASHEVDRS